MKLEKSFTPILITTMITTAILLVVGFFLVFYGMPPESSSGAVMPHDLWRYGWTDGFVARNSTCSIDVHCRLSHFRRLIASPLISWRLGLIAIAALIGSAVTFVSLYEQTPLRETATTILGNRVFYDADARRSLRTHLRRPRNALDNALWLMPFVQLTPAAEESNILMLGDQGSGKTGVMRSWIQQILERGLRCVLHDAKGDLTASLPANQFILLAVRDARSWIWAIGRDIVNPQDALEVAARFVPSNATGETMWTDAARIVLAMALKRLYQGVRQRLLADPSDELSD